MAFAYRIVGALAASLVALGAEAATISTTTVLPNAAVPNPFATSIIGTVGENVTTSVAGLRRSPWQGTPHAGSPFTAVAGGATAIYSFGQDADSFSFLWGSVDRVNTIQLFDDGALVDTISGALFRPRGSAGIPFLTVAVTNVLFDELRFSSGGNSFEYANLSVSEVPLPAGFVLLVSALGGLVLLRRRATA